ncbi:fimbrial protein [Leminorella grimontii]|uniref:fimbrial protein n=1 Tax=Leminorella grimontii TaxID=82981 RepID=UPI0032201818
MSAILGGNPEAVLYKCRTLDEVNNANAILRLDDTFAIYGTYMYNGVAYHYMNYYASAANNYGTVAYKMAAVMHDGTERDLVFNDGRYNNTDVTFLKSGYEESQLSDSATYPWVVKVKHYPSVRLTMIRTSYDTNRSTTYWEGYYGRIAYDNPVDGYNYDATYGYIKLYNHIAAPVSSCGVTQVPRTVNLGTYSIADIRSGRTSWSPFTVTYQCNNDSSPVNSLRLGIQPQIASNLLSSDYRYLKPDEGGASGVGIVYRRQGQSAYRNWIQNSGCIGISTDAENHSNCFAASGQGESEGWYSVNPEGSSASAISGNTDYYETFEASIQPLPDGGAISPGTVVSTVNVLVNLP